MKELKRVFLLMVVFSFVVAASLTSCREQKKADNTEQQEEHPTGEEHPSDDGAAKEEHPTSEEHPSDDGAAKEEHPAGGDEHPTSEEKDSIGGNEHSNN